MWGLQLPLDLSPLVSLLRTAKLTLWAQGASHLSPAPQGVMHMDMGLKMDQGLVDRKALSHRAGREAYCDWPRARSLYAIISTICQIEDKTIRDLQMVLHHCIVSRELPTLENPNANTI